MGRIPNFSINFEQAVMNALLVRDDVPITIVLTKVIQDSIETAKELEYIKSKGLN